MPVYVAQAYLTKDGKVFEPGKEIELTEEQGKKLKDKVELRETEEVKAPDENPEKYTENSLRKLSADEQKEIVTELDGNLEELTNEDKRVEFILENQE
ncbi:hypothetical protein [Halobacillus naozhouensis]|uniref:YqbF C-terminal domain-containing protein n=1 Tax=Halobacillus naozhouensis TaxID=554880 RepID=A0ABY8J470_9BACI|nr:hypothetical protein [Halobacillus naozhouensis]WFT76239.1 hypothetical protein P9989_07715 [Halobacillus naozhouensis]